MNRHIIALTGLSGVGKSTLLRKLATTLKFQCLQASALIKDGRHVAGDGVTSVDRLRGLNLDENQKLLVRGFELRVDRLASLVILDSHTIIERDDDLVPIAVSVFQSIGIQSMIFLAENPTVISDRRVRDSTRKRVVKSLEAIEAAQVAAKIQAEHICWTLNIPLHVFSVSESDNVERVLRSYT